MLETLDTEIRTFDDLLPEMLREHAGEYVLIKGTTVHGFFPDMDTAIAEGYRRLDGPPFLAKRVEIETPVFFAARRLRSAHAR